MQWHNSHAGFHRRRSFDSDNIQPAVGDIDLTPTRSIEIRDIDQTNPNAHTTYVAPTDTGSANSHCQSGTSDSSCYPVSTTSTNTLPILLGVLLPLVCAFGAFIYLHQRYKRRIRSEEAQYKHGSLDFGLGEGKRKGKRGPKSPGPEMKLNGADLMRPGRGMSMDMGSPYILPGELTGSRASFHSMSRSMNDGEDPYSPVAFVKDQGSPHGTSIRAKDSASVFTQSSDSRDPLISNAHKPSLATPPEINEHLQMPEPIVAVPRKPVGAINAVELPSDKASPPNGALQPPPRTASKEPAPLSPDFRPSVPEKEVVPQIIQPSSASAHDSRYDENAPYADILGIVQKDDMGPILANETYDLPSLRDQNAHEALGWDPSAFTSTLRPLPDYDPNDSAEQRALRIRSFYREYFDEYTGGNVEGGAMDYYEDYGQEYGHVAPFAQDVGRRAMTPPPRGPPRFKSRGPGGRGGPPSAGSAPRARAHSSASHHHARGKPLKRLPPPKPLNNLPTPYLLQNEAAIMGAMDFAPPITHKERQLGGASSPLMGARPYSPSVKAFTPLKSSFMEMPSMPSPHHLRKSGTFTALDFAPSPRFAHENGSDNGSIRSGHSNLSPYHQANIKRGAYRVSRLPQDTVGTRDDLAATLKPRWDIGRA